MTTERHADVAVSKILKSTGIVVAISIFVKLFGFVEKLILAYYFGTAQAMDCYLVAIGAALMLFIMVREIVEPSFLPTFMRVLRGSGEEEGWRFFSSAATMLLAALGAVCIVGVAAAPRIVHALAPGFDEPGRELTARLLRILMPASLFLGLSTLTYITLNAYKRFAVPAVSDALFKIVPIVFLVLLFKARGIAGLAAGVVAGAAARLLAHCVDLRGRLRRLRPRSVVGSPPLRTMYRLMLPLFFGIAFSQLSVLVDNAFASTLSAGSISALAYARKLTEMPIVIAPYALGIVLFPYCSELAIAGEYRRLVDLLIHSIQMLIVLFVPVAMLFIVLRAPLVRAVFERGAFDGYSSQITSSALLYYACGLVSFAVEAIVVPFYFSMSDTKTPVVVGIICVCANILITYLLITPLRHNGIALALTISKTVKVLALCALLGRRFPMIDFSGTVRLTGKALCAGGIAGAIVYGGLSYSEPLIRSRFVYTLVAVASLSVVGVAAYVAAGAALRIREYSMCRDYIVRVIRRRAHAEGASEP